LAEAIEAYTATYGSGITEEQFPVLWAEITRQFQENPDFGTPQIMQFDTSDESLEEAAAILYTDGPEMHDEPTTYEEAIKSQDAYEWLKAMTAEYEEHVRKGTFEIVEPPEGANILGGKWVYKYKRNSEGKIIRWKARWVIKGYTQIHGVDYTDTFAPTVRASTHRALLALAAVLDLEVYQMDFITAYLNSDLDEYILAEQMTGFEEGPLDASGRPKKAYRVKRGLYGLKQSVR